MQLDHLNVLAAFLTIAEERSFTKAAKRLGVSRSALSHAVRGWKSASASVFRAHHTQRGADGGWGTAHQSPASRAGRSRIHRSDRRAARAADRTRVRLLVTPLSATMVLSPSWCHLPVDSRTSSSTSPRRKRDARSSSPRASTLAFTSANPFNATWWRCECLAITGWRVGSPDYFASHPKPSSPHDLPNHRCINLRGGSSGPLPLGVRERR